MMFSQEERKLVARRMRKYLGAAADDMDDDTLLVLRMVMVWDETDEQERADLRVAAPALGRHLDEMLAIVTGPACDA